MEAWGSGRWPGWGTGEEGVGGRAAQEAEWMVCSRREEEGRHPGGSPPLWPEDRGGAAPTESGSVEDQGHGPPGSQGGAGRIP